MPVLVGVQVRVVDAASQPHVVAVLELVHRSPAAYQRGARAGCGGGGEDEFLISWPTGAPARTSESCWLRWAPKREYFKVADAVVLE